MDTGTIAMGVVLALIAVLVVGVNMFTGSGAGPNGSDDVRPIRPPRGPRRY